MQYSRPVPNQPLFVWQPVQSIFTARGTVTAPPGRKFHGVGHVIAGVQRIYTLPVQVVGTAKAGRFYMHGLVLHSFWMLGSTRFRFLMIVHVWNYVVNRILITAVSDIIKDSASVIASSSSVTGDNHVTYLHIGGLDKTERVVLYFSVHQLRKIVSTLIACPAIVSKSFNTFITPVVSMVDKTFKIFIVPPLQSTAKLSKLFIDPVTTHIGRLFKLKSDVALSDLTGVSKLHVFGVDKKLVMKAKLSSHLQRMQFDHTAKVLVRIVRSTINAVFKLSVHPLKRVLDEVMSYIRFDTESQWLDQTLDVVAHTQEEHVEVPSLVHMEVKQDTQAVVKVSFSLSQVVAYTKGLIVNLYSFVANNLLKVDLYQAKRDAYVNIGLEGFLREQSASIRFCLESFSSGLQLHAGVEILRDQLVLLEADIISILGATNLLFRPTELPQVLRTSVYMSTCKSHIIAYLSFIPDEIKQAVEVHMSTCSYTALSLVQWYLHRSRVSNEGYGNEIIFDLGDVDPIGPIPPAPSQVWDGGYVEDPFQGAGYVPAVDTTGYTSPSVDEWVKNAKMYWSKETTPFNDPTIQQP